MAPRALGGFRIGKSFQVTYVQPVSGMRFALDRCYRKLSIQDHTRYRSESMSREAVLELDD